MHNVIKLGTDKSNFFKNDIRKNLMDQCVKLVGMVLYIATNI